MNEEPKRLPAAELDVMLAVWRAQGPVTSGEIQKELTEKQWVLPTLLSLLSRLCEKGFLSMKKKGRQNIYLPRIRREEYLKMESATFLDKLYGNSVKSFVASLYDSKAVSAADLDELRAFLDAAAPPKEKE